MQELGSAPLVQNSLAFVSTLCTNQFRKYQIKPESRNKKSWNAEVKITPKNKMISKS